MSLLRGVGDDLTSSITGLVRLLRIDEYAGLAVMGTSGGGLPAVLAALKLGAGTALSVSGNSPFDERWTSDETGAAALDILRQGVHESAGTTRITLLHSAGNAVDAAAAAGLAASIPASTVITVPGDNHNALLGLLEGGGLRTFLHDTVLAQQHA